MVSMWSYIIIYHLTFFPVEGTPGIVPGKQISSLRSNSVVRKKKKNREAVNQLNRVLKQILNQNTKLIQEVASLKDLLYQRPITSAENQPENQELEVTLPVTSLEMFDLLEEKLVEDVEQKKLVSILVFFILIYF